MSTSGMVPMIGPDGTTADVPLESVHIALQQGARQAALMVAPDGSKAYVPYESIGIAKQQGAKLFSEVPTQFEQERDPANQPGFLKSAASEAGNLIAGAASLPQQAMNPAAGIQVASQIAGDDQARAMAGRSAPYRAAAAVGSLAGVNAAGMERAADVGNTRGVLGTAAADAAPAVVPLALKGAGAATSAIADKAVPFRQALAERLYQSALKPPPGSYSTGEVSSMVKTGIENEIPVSAAGAEKISGLVQKLSDDVKAQIGSRPGATINKFAVASRLNDTAARFSNQVAPSGDLADIAQTGNDFLKTQPGEIPVADAQALKQGTYQQLKARSFGELRSATIESQKALARGIKEEVQQQFPEIQQLNAKEGALIGLDGALERAVRRIDNRELLGWGGTMGGATGAVVGGGLHAVGAGPGAVVGAVLIKILDNPAVKSNLAFALAKSSGGSMGAGYLRIGQYAAGLSGAAKGASPTEPK